jgi:lysozyme
MTPVERVEKMLSMNPVQPEKSTDNLIEEIKRHEGYRRYAYRDSEGVLTIGYGLNLDDGISEPLAGKIVEWIVDERRETLSRMLPFWNEMTERRREVFLNMVFNLGVSRFMKFKKMLVAADLGDVDGVCREMKDSRWHGQVGKRADELIEKYRIG